MQLLEQILFTIWNVPIRFPTLACCGNEDFSALSGPYPEHRRKLHYQEHQRALPEISTRARTGRGDGGGGKKNQVAQIVFGF